MHIHRFTAAASIAAITLSVVPVAASACGTGCTGYGGQDYLYPGQQYYPQYNYGYNYGYNQYPYGYNYGYYPYNTYTTPAPTCTITYAQAAYAGYGSVQPYTLSWSTSNATSASISPSIGTLSDYVNGTRTVYPSTYTTYVMTVSGPGGTGYCQTSVQPVMYNNYGYSNGYYSQYNYGYYYPQQQYMYQYPQYTYQTYPYQYDYNYNNYNMYQYPTYGGNGYYYTY